MKHTVNNQLVLVLGLGDSGLATLRWLHAQGAQLRVADSREQHANVDVIKKEMPNAVIHMGEFDAAIFEGVAFAVISPGIAISTPVIQQAINNGLAVMGDVELFAQYRDPSAKVVGITGSNGKTTVTTLVGEMCKSAGLNTIVAGNIGLPVMAALMMETPDVYVLELSSFQLETTTNLALDVATMLNLSEDHMDRYESFQDYAIAKARIFYHATCQVLNRDDAWSMMMTRPKLAQVSFGLDCAEDAQDFGLIEQEDGLWLAEGDKPLMSVESMAMVGLHNVANALAAIAICRQLGIEHAAILKTVYDFKGLPHRVAYVDTIDDVDYYDDSKGTNVGATCAAISGLAQPIVLIAGGEGKGQDFNPLVSVVKAHVDAVVLMGTDAPLMEAALLATEVPIYQALDLPEAVNIAKKVAKKDSAVLLSPACASFDMFDNYVHRAAVFINAVEKLKPELAAGEGAW